MAAIRTLLIFALTLNAFAGNVTGTFATGGNTPISNGTLTFTASQTFYKSDGTGVTVASPVSCYTSTDGSVVGVPNAIIAPTVGQTTSGGTVPANTYYVKIAYYNATGTGLASAESTVVTSTGASTITVTMPVLQPATATGIRIYIGTTPGGETLQSSTANLSSTATVSSYSVGSALPSTNTSVCQLTFNDAGIPSYTTYSTNLTDSAGNRVPGFPQNYYLSGATVNLALMIPAGNLKALFPSAIIANPSGSATQSINGGLQVVSFQVNGASITVGAGAPVGTCTTGNIYLRTDGGASTTLYVCGAAAWVAK